MLPLILPLLATLLPPETVPLVVIDDLTDVEHTAFDQDHALDVINDLLDEYQQTGMPIPEVLSVWTAFPFNDNTIETRFIPIKNDVTGIGLENAYGVGEEVFDQFPPMRAMLIHNDATELRSRADFERLTDLDAAAFGEYLFLLELSHLWGPELHLPGAPADRLIGFDFHSSFFLDNPAGTGIVGGNHWVDNGDGTFTAQPVDYANLAYSALELYLMGLVPSSEVPAFGLITDAVVPADALDPFSNRAVSRASFPWQGPDALTVTATREALTMDDVIAQNGTRAPAFGDSPSQFTLGIALVIPFGVTEDERNQLVRDFAPVAARFAPGFARATGNRCSFSVVTSSPAPPAPVPDDIVEKPAHNKDSDTDGAGGCVQASPSMWIAIVGFVVKKKRRRDLETDTDIEMSGPSTTPPAYVIDKVRAPDSLPRVR